jgi:hypothetical protein
MASYNRGLKRWLATFTGETPVFSVRVSGGVGRLRWCCRGQTCVVKLFRQLNWFVLMGLTNQR